MSHQRRLLLLQIRNANDPMREHELQCFVETCQVPRERIVSVDAIDREFERLNPDDYAALMVGGSGDYSMTQPHADFFEPMMGFLRELVEASYPILASCFGFQAMAVALGGTIVRDEAHTEVGTFQIRRTDAALEDPLFAPLPQRFMAQFGHKDHIDRMPEGAVTLARGDFITCQAYRVAGKPIWATQFHPELTRESNRHRYLAYLDRYGRDEPESGTMDSFQESLEATALLPRFVKMVDDGVR